MFPNLRPEHLQTLRVYQQDPEFRALLVALQPSSDFRWHPDLERNGSRLSREDKYDLWVYETARAVGHMEMLHIFAGDLKPDIEDSGQ